VEALDVVLTGRRCIVSVLYRGLRNGPVVQGLREAYFLDDRRHCKPLSRGVAVVLAGSANGRVVGEGGVVCEKKQPKTCDCGV